MHPEQGGLLALADGEHMVLGTGGPEMNAVSLGGNLLQRPYIAVELR